MAKEMPHNTEAEMSVLGVAFISKEQVNKICESLNEDMFYDERNKAIFSAIKILNDNHSPLDITTLKNELDKVKKLTLVGLDYITDVIDSVITSANIDHYIQIVKDYYIRRTLITTATNIIENSYNENDIKALQDTAEKNILLAVRNRSVQELIPISDALRIAHDKLEELAKTKKLITGLETGFYDFDRITTGFQGGEMIIIAARPGMGKTALALNMATFAATTTKKAIAIFNLEMPAEMLVNRMISSQGRIDAYKLATGNMNEKDWQRYNEATNELIKTNIQIDTDASATMAEIRAKCRRLASSEEGLALVVIDYLQLINPGGKRSESRQVEVSEFSRAIKTMALELNVPVIALSQLSRSVEKRESNVPTLADLRDSGSLEQDADIVAFINRKDYYDPDKSQRENIVPAELIIAKHRKGSLGLVNLMFELNLSKFRSVSKHDEESENEN